MIELLNGLLCSNIKQSGSVERLEFSPGRLGAAIVWALLGAAIPTAACFKAKKASAD